MCVQAVIEITSSSDGRLPARLLSEAYRASDCGMIILILNGVAPVAVDGLLDHVVASLPLSIPGVLYVDAGDEAAVDGALCRTGIVFVATSRLLRRAWGSEMDRKVFMPVDLALAWLAGRYERLRVDGPPAPAAVPTAAREDLVPLPA